MDKKKYILGFWILAILVLIGASTAKIFDAVKIKETLNVDTINEYVTDAGVTIETVLVKDGLVDGKDVSTLGIGDVTGPVTNTDNNVPQWNGADSKTLKNGKTIGIADDNLVEMDDSDAADNDYAKLTANGIEGRSYSEVKQDLSLDNVENTALSTWGGSVNITTVGTLGAGTWQGNAIGAGYGGTGQDTTSTTGIAHINSGTWTFIKYTYSETSAPTVNDDSGDGFAIGSIWIDVTANKAYICLDNTASAAVWTETTQAAASLALNDLTDVTLTGAAQGDILYRNETAWVNLAAGDSGKYLKTQGAGANPIWDTPAGAGDMAKATYDADTDDKIDADAGGTDQDSSGWTGLALVTAGVWSAKTIGIADDNSLEVDDAAAADDEYCRFTANGIEGRSVAEVKTDIGYDYDIIYIDAGAMVPCTTNGAESGTHEYGTNDIDWDYFAFDGGAIEERVQFKLVMPPTWDRSTVKVKFYWSSATGSTAGDTVEWAIKAGALADSDAIDTALGTPQVITDTLLADNGTDLQITDATPALTVAGTPGVGELITWEVYRNTDGTDDMAEDAWLVGVAIQYKRTNTVSAW